MALVVIVLCFIFMGILYYFDRTLGDKIFDILKISIIFVLGYYFGEKSKT